eukprot:TRINITY_DN6190_c0_g1_i1.p2 TRINITY_DN6190_c0_g1~~TRINITY_DN6190_c0_g1_i1.p2  ORF type:complete len:261 (+),score=28.20 TRINITY_DN6190_c0_g1_i1:108-785(+)
MFILVAFVSAVFAAVFAEKNVCQDCDKVVGAVTNVLSNSEVLDNIQDFIEEKYCNILEDGINEKCSTYAQMYLPQVFAQLTEKLSQSSTCNSNPIICPEHLTPAAYRTVGTLFQAAKQTLANAAFTPLSQEPSGPHPYCGYCELVVGELGVLIQEDDAKALVIQYVETICKDLPYDVDQCDDLANMYVDEVFQLLKSYMDPEELCGYLGYCVMAASATTGYDVVA